MKSSTNIFITGILAAFLLLLIVFGLGGCRADATDTPGRLSGASQEVAAVNSKVAAAAQNIFHFAQQNPPSIAQIIREHQIILAAVGQPTPKDAKDGVSRRNAGPDDKVYEVAIADAYERGKAAGLAVSESEKAAARDEANRAAKQARVDALVGVFIWGARLSGIIAGSCLLGVAASFAMATTFPPLVAARGALGCVAIAAGVCSLLCAGMVLAVNTPWVLALLCLLALLTLFAAGHRLWRMEPKGAKLGNMEMLKS